MWRFHKGDGDEGGQEEFVTNRLQKREEVKKKSKSTPDAAVINVNE